MNSPLGFCHGHIDMILSLLWSWYYQMLPHGMIPIKIMLHYQSNRVSSSAECPDLQRECQPSVAEWHRRACQTQQWDWWCIWSSYLHYFRRNWLSCWLKKRSLSQNSFLTLLMRIVMDMSQPQKWNEFINPGLGSYTGSEHRSVVSSSEFIRQIDIHAY